jgi:UDP-glucose 4-epimerase
METVIVTGSQGFIGTHTKMALLEQGYAVRPIDKKKSPTGWSGNVTGNITDVGKMDRYFKNAHADYVIHLAANSSLQKSVVNAHYDAMNNVIGTIVILAMCQRYGIKKIVFASTTAVYSEKAPMPLDEWSVTDPVIPYGISKLACENYIRASGVPYTILRYGNVYGPGQKPLGESILIARCLSHIFQKKPFMINGDGSKTRDYVYVSDVVKANIKAMHTDHDGTYLIGTGHSVSVNEICDTLKSLTAWAHDFTHGPDKPGELQDVKFNTMMAYNGLGWRAQLGIESGLKLTVDAWPK